MGLRAQAFARVSAWTYMLRMPSGESSGRYGLRILQKVDFFRILTLSCNEEAGVPVGNLSPDVVASFIRRVEMLYEEYGHNESE
jgi:hypothetical protein